MGVSGLWAEIKPVAVRQSFEKTAFQIFDEAYEELQDGHPIPKGTTLGLRVGIDASAWFIHSEKSEGGANPALRNMFHRVIRLARAGVRALFVFDGPHRPSVKRGHRIYRGSHSMQHEFERIVEAFGFEWRTAPGEAEAELAYLNRRGSLDLVITDDVDCLLFGATSLMKHALINQPTESIHPQLFERGTIELELDLTVSGLILVALMSGGDYDTGGLTGIGPKISLALAKARYGERLQNIMLDTRGSEMQAHLQTLRDEIRHELATNQTGFFERKAGAVAKKFHDDWPNIAVANSYYNAVTSELPKYKHFDKQHSWNRKIDVPALVAILDELFEFIHAEILQKLRSQIWECVVVQDLIWRIRDNGVTVSETNSPDGTPSKVLTASLGTVTLSSPTKAGSDGTINPAVVPHRIDKKRGPLIKEHVTDELQLIVDPTSMAVLAEAQLRHPDPNIGKLEARKAAEAAEICALHGPEHPGAIPAAPRNSHFDHPYEMQKLWIQESLLRMALPNMVREWEEREQAKLELKANKGKKAAAKASPKKANKDPKAKASTPTKTRHKPAKAKKVVDSESEAEGSSALLRTASDDVFTSPASGPSSSAMQKANSDPVPRLADRKAPIRVSSYKRSQSKGDLSSSTSSGSDIEIIAGGKNTRKSPKKSSRKAISQTTVRDVDQVQGEVASHSLPSISSFNVVKKGSEVPKATTGKDIVSNKAKAQPKKPYTYRDLLDTSADSSDDDLPSLTRLLKTKDKNTTKAKHGTEENRAHKAENVRQSSAPAAATKSKPSSRRAVNSALQPAAREVIDLCSSD